MEAFFFSIGGHQIVQAVAVEVRQERVLAPGACGGQDAGDLLEVEVGMPGGPFGGHIARAPEQLLEGPLGEGVPDAGNLVLLRLP
jgi:hypothetical protein